MTDHVLTKRKLKDIPDIKSFSDLIDAVKISDEDKEILRYIYLQEKNINWIADTLGFSPNTIKRKHAFALKKLSMLF